MITNPCPYQEYLPIIFEQRCFLRQQITQTQQCI